MGLTEVKPGVVFGWVDHGVDRVLDWAKCGLGVGCWSGMLLVLDLGNNKDRSVWFY